MLDSYDQEDDIDDPLEEADQALEREDYPLAEKLAKALINSDDMDEREYAQETLALALFHQKKYHESLDIYILRAQSHNGGRDWMNVSTNRALIGDAEGASEAMEKAIGLQNRLIKNTPEFKNAPLEDILTPPFMIYYLIRALCEGGKAAKAIPWLERLRAFYEKRSSDPKRLAASGIPSLKQMIAAIRDVANGAGAEFDKTKWVKAFQASLDKDGKLAIAAFLKEK